MSLEMGNGKVDGYWQSAVCSTLTVGQYGDVSWLSSKLTALPFLRTEYR